MLTKVQQIYERVADRLKDPNFRIRSIQRPEDFSRHRKWSFSSLMAMILNRVDRTTAVEVQHFCKTHLADVGRLTKQAFSKARYKIKPEAFTALNHTAMEAFYTQGDYRQVHGFLPVAIDGSILEIPNTPTLREAFGAMSDLARARISHAFDVANGLCLSAIGAPCTTSERDLARLNIAEVRKILGTHFRILWLEDRGYPAFPFWMELDNAGEKYLMRVPSTFYPEEFGPVERDAWVGITVTPERAREFAAQGHPVPVGTVLHLRVIKLLLPSGETEILATNVSAQELPYERAGAVYFSRWGVEVHFDVLKNRFEISNFAGILPAAIYQEHQATVLLGNLCALAEAEAQALWDAQQAEHPEDYKYARYKINTSVSVGQWKDAWVTIMLAEDADVRNQAFWDFIHEIRKHVTPIRPNRQFPRRSAPRANRYSHKRRRSL